MQRRLMLTRVWCGRRTRLAMLRLFAAAVLGRRHQAEAVLNVRRALVNARELGTHCAAASLVHDCCFLEFGFS